jgi:hypothetical protein
MPNISGFDSWRDQIFREVVGLELSLLSTTEELPEKKNSGFGLETKITAVGDPPRRLCDIPLSAKLGTNFADKWRPV